MKINIKFQAMSILMAELQEPQMWAIYQMGIGNEMPGSGTKTDITCIIAFLFKILDWIEDRDQSSNAEFNLENNEDNDGPMNQPKEQKSLKIISLRMRV